MNPKETIFIYVILININMEQFNRARSFSLNTWTIISNKRLKVFVSYILFIRERVALSAKAHGFGMTEWH